MMKKLFKWDVLSYIYQLKWLVVGAVLLTTLAALFDYLSSIHIMWSFFYQTAFMIAVVGVIISMIYAYFVIFQRYYQTVLKDEAYFTHTLPISKIKILLSKTLAAFSIFTLSLLIGLGLFIWLEVISLAQFFELSTSNPDLFNMSLLSIASAVIMLYVTIPTIYAALSFGFSYNKKEWLYVFLYFVMYYVANQILSMMNMGINLLFNPKLFELPPDEIISAITPILIVQLLISVGLGVFNFYMAKYYITKKLNLKNG